MQERRQQAGASRPRKFLLSLSGVTLLFLAGLIVYPGWHPVFRLGLVALLALIMLTALTTTRGPILCRCVLPLLIGVFCVESYILLHGLDVAPEITKFFVFGDKYNEIFYSGIATLYAIITALALVKGIEDFDATKRHVSDEAYKVRAISEMTHYFEIDKDGEARNAVLSLRRNLLRYTANVAALRDQRIDDENLRLLRDCQRHIAKLEPRDANDQESLQVMVSAHSELGTLRSKRINAIGEKIPRYLIAALWLMALALILPFTAEPLVIPATPPELGLVDNPARFGQYYIIFLLGALNSFLLLMLSDISDPFEGFWVVSMQPFRVLSAALGEDLGEISAAGPVQAALATVASSSPGTFAGSSSSSRI
ncbi:MULTISPECIES: DUF4239 domain-containing protein [Rhodomicrobium]|uniref:bestrophin-like domain n=1 Tax=Rhodomicrobium TaxID=1068 RepID=UPI000B4ADE5E|nr:MULTISPECIES: DUF4239 domain-containing protein [Rhodomicrobium]